MSTVEFHDTYYGLASPVFRKPLVGRLGSLYTFDAFRGYVTCLSLFSAEHSTIHLTYASTVPCAHEKSADR
jgi:hypothetical protein